MALSVVRNRAVTPSRRSSYVIAVLVNAALLLAVNWWPGWEAVPVFSQEMRLVVGLVNLTILVNLAANLVYLANDPSWLRALGELATLGVGMAALVQLWRTFPFALSMSSFEWTLVARSVLVLGMLGSVIGIVATYTSFTRAVTNAAPDRAV